MAADPRNNNNMMDPFEEDSINANIILNFANDQNPTLEDFESTAEQPVAVAAREAYGVGGSGFEKMGMVELLSHFSFGGGGGQYEFEAGPSSNVGGDQGRSSNFEEGDEMQIPSEVESRLLAIWPTTPLPFLCSCCQVLREFLHTNGYLSFSFIFFKFYNFIILVFFKKNYY